MTAYGPSKKTTGDVVNVIEDHMHSTSCLYPKLAAPVELTCGDAAPYTPGVIVEIVPASTITEPFDIHWAHVSGLSANGDYVISLYAGAVASEVEIACFPAVRTAVQSQAGSAAVMTAIIPANTRISASVASSSGDADTVNLKIQYHKY